MVITCARIPKCKADLIDDNRRERIPNNHVLYSNSISPFTFLHLNKI